MKLWIKIYIKSILLYLAPQLEVMLNIPNTLLYEN